MLTGLDNLLTNPFLHLNNLFTYLPPIRHLENHGVTSLRNTSTCVREALKIGYCGPARSTYSLSLGSAHWGIVGPAFPALGPPEDCSSWRMKRRKIGGGMSARAEARTRKLGMTSLGAPLGGDLLEGGLHMTNGVPYV